MTYNGPTIRCQFCGMTFRCENPPRVFNGGSARNGEWTRCAEPKCGRTFHHAGSCKDGSVILRAGATAGDAA